METRPADDIKGQGECQVCLKPVTWMMAYVDTDLCEVLLHKTLDTGYLLGKQLMSNRANQCIAIGDVIHREEGTNGASYFRTGKRVVIKAFTDAAEGQREAYLTSFACSGRCKSSRIVRLVGLFAADENTVYIVQEYIPGGDLLDRMLLSEAEPVPQSVIRTWFIDLLEALIHLQRRRMAHMDISPENIMVDEKGHCKLIDFGLSLCMPPSHGSGTVYEGLPRVGKSGYMAAEVYRRKAYDPYAADMWSLGIVFYVIETGRPLYRLAGDKAFRLLEEGRFDELLEHYNNMGYTVPEGHTRELIRLMLHPIPSQRPSPEEALNTILSSYGSQDRP